MARPRLTLRTREHLAFDDFSLHQRIRACPVSAKTLKACGKKPRPCHATSMGSAVEVAGAEVVWQVKFRTAEEVAGVSKMQSAQLNCLLQGSNDVLEVLTSTRQHATNQCFR